MGADLQHAFISPTSHDPSTMTFNVYNIVVAHSKTCSQLCPNLVDNCIYMYKNSLLQVTHTFVANFFFSKGPTQQSRESQRFDCLLRSLGNMEGGGQINPK